MKQLFRISSFILFFGLIGCIDRYDPKLTSDKQKLVVEAQITTQLEFQYVFLTFDAGYNSEENLFKFLVKRAKVNIVDDNGKIYEFEDEKLAANSIKSIDGYNYKSINKFKLEVGRSYRLNIETVEGTKYQSEFETVVPVPPVSKTTLEYKELAPPFKNDLKAQWNVYVDVQDPVGVKNFYKWETLHYKQLEYCREWYIYGSGGSVTQAFIDKCCTPCYEYEKCEECFELANDVFVDGNKLIRQYVATVPYNNTTPYFLQVNQYSLTEKAYKFWLAVQQQSKNSGGLFDATPKSIKGNIKNINNPEEEVLGYFSVVDVFPHRINVNRNITGTKPVIKPEYGEFWNRTETCYPCEETYKRKKTPPIGWIN